MPPKVRITFCRFARKCFTCACMGVNTQLKLCLHEQTQTVPTASWKVGTYCSDFLARYPATYLFPYFLLAIFIL